MSKEVFGELLPWLNLDALPLPEGYAVVAYSEATSAWHRENPFFQENYPGLPLGAYWVWVSDGFEAIIIEVFAATGEEIVITADSYLEVVELPSGAAAVALAGQPATIEVQGSDLSGPDITEILLSLTGVREIRNQEALARDPLVNLLAEQESIDYASLPREPVTKEEFFRLNPWTRLSSAKQPAGFSVTGIYQVEYPQEIKEKFTLHKEHPDREIWILFWNSLTERRCTISAFPLPRAFIGNACWEPQSALLDLTGLKCWPTAPFSQSTLRAVSFPKTISSSF